jgi:hypothetical protein
LFFRDLKVFIGASAIATIIWPGFQVFMPAGAVERQSGPRLRIELTDEPRPGIQEKWEQDIDAPSPLVQADDEPVHPMANPKVSSYMQRSALAPVQKTAGEAPAAPKMTVRQARIEINAPAEAQPTAPQMTLRQARIEINAPAEAQPAAPQITLRQARIEINSPHETQPEAINGQVPASPGLKSASHAQPKGQGVPAVKLPVEAEEVAQRQAEALKASQVAANERLARQQNEQAAWAQKQKAQAQQEQLARAAKESALAKASQERQIRREALAQEAQARQHQREAIAKAAQAERAQQKALREKQALALAQEKALLKQKEQEEQAQARERLLQQQALAQQELLERKHQQEILEKASYEKEIQQKALLKQQELEERAQQKALQKKQALALAEKNALLAQKALEQQAQAIALKQQVAIERKQQREVRRQEVLARQAQQNAVKAQQALALQQQRLQQQMKAHQQEVQRLARQQAPALQAQAATMQPVRSLANTKQLPLAIEAPVLSVKSLAPVAMPATSPADSWRATQQEVARYSDLLAAWRQSNPKQSLEPVLLQGQVAVAAILREEGNLTPEAKQALRQQMQGYLWPSQRGINAIPDSAYFAEQAQRHGLPADVAFTALMRQTLHGFLPVTRVQISGMSGCTRFGSHDLVRLYGVWKAFQNTYPTAYVQLLKDPNLLLLPDIEDQLLNSHSACNGPDSVQDELQSFIAGYPDSDLTPRLQKRLANLHRKSAGMVFYQGVQNAAFAPGISH